MKTRAPLFVIGVQDDAQDAETLERPVQEPGLARILADVARWEALSEVSQEKVEVVLALKGGRGRGVEGDVFEEDGLGFCLAVRGFGEVLIIC